VALGGAVLTVGAANAAADFAGAIGGNGGLTKLGSAVQTLSGVNTFTGTATIAAGTLRLAGGAALADTVAVVLANAAGAILDLNGSDETIGSLAGGGGAGGAVTLGAGTLTTGGDGTSTVFAGVISGSGGVVKAGAGTFTLTGANAHTGPTRETAGTLLVDGIQAGSPAQVSGGVLGGTGTVGAITATGGAIRPGSAAARGVLSAGGADLSAGAAPAITIRIADFTGPGTAYDRLDLQSGGGALVLGGGATLILDLAGLDPTPSTAGVVTGAVLYASRSGSFAAVQLVNNPSGYAAALRYQPNGLDVVLTHPFVIARTTSDSDHDGHLDRIELVAGGPLTDDFSGLAVSVAGYTVVGYATGAAANDDRFEVLLQPQAGFDTGARPLVQVSANSSLATVGGTLVQVETGGTAPADGAPPVLVSAVWSGLGASGVAAGDPFTLTFSEPVATTGLVLGDLVLPVAGDTLGGGAASAIPDQSGSRSVGFALPAGPAFTVAGTYAASALAAGSPSGIYLAVAAHVADLASPANPASVGSAPGDALDIGYAPFITAAVTGDSDGDGHVDRLTLTFSSPVAIVDGGGAADGFAGLSLSGGYAIANRDYSAASTTTLVLVLVPQAGLDTGAVISATYHAGTAGSIIGIAPAVEMPEGTTVAGSDGAAPVFSGVLPLAGTVVEDTRLSYTLSETLAAGTVTWTRVGGNPDPAPHVQALAGAELAAGAHDAITLGADPTLVSGAVYDLVFAGVDLAGNPAVAITRAGVIYQTPGLPRPRIVSEATLWAVAGQPWTYDVRVAAGGLQPQLGLTVTYALSFALPGAPAGATIVPTGTSTARVTWNPAAGLGQHVRVTVVVTDTVSHTSDQQDILIYVIAAPSAGG
jgi:autotransporter-associated beta strand protein